MQRRPVVILDFGSQYTQLIARRIREQHVYCEIHPCTKPLDEVKALHPIALVLSGGPNSKYESFNSVPLESVRITINGTDHDLAAGSFVYMPPATDWSFLNAGNAPCTFHWIRKAYKAVEGISPPDVVVTSEADQTPEPMPGCDGRWSTTRFLDRGDMRHDLMISIVNFEPGGVIPFAETHVMEHGLYVLEGKAVYRLNQDWVEVEAGDFMWLRAFCPQAC